MAMNMLNCYLTSMLLCVEEGEENFNYKGEEILLIQWQ
jgi:hypothetical protein